MRILSIRQGKTPPFFHMKPRKKSAKLQRPRQCATLIYNDNGWYVRYPDKTGTAVRLKLTAMEYPAAIKEAKLNLPAGIYWVIA